MITINKNGNEEQYIYAKDLHEALEFSEANYTAWIKRHLLNNPAVSEGKGYKRRANRWPNASYKEYGLSIDFAITLSTKSRSSKSEEVTTYLLQAETKEKTSMEYFDTEVEEEKVEEPKVKETSMELIIPIFKSVIGEDKEEVNSVSARELHEGLESKQDFSHWVTNKVKNNTFFTEGEDWISLDNIIERASTRAAAGGNNKKEYALTLDAAKKVAMSEQTAKGNDVRNYFLRKEAEANDPTQKMSYIEKPIQEELNLRSFKVGLEIAKLAGKEGGAAVSAANRATIHYQGEDILQIMQIADVITEDHTTYYNVRDICKRISVSAIEFNRLLVVAGLQEKVTYNPMSNEGYYAPTERGKKYSYSEGGDFKSRDTGFLQHSLRWCIDVLDLVTKAHLEGRLKEKVEAGGKVVSPVVPKEAAPAQVAPTKVTPVVDLPPVVDGIRQVYMPKELGARVGISGKRFNQVLGEAGFQVQGRDRFDRSFWTPTSAAQGLYQRVSKSVDAEGRTTFRLLWFEEILSKIEEYTCQEYPTQIF